MKNIKVVTSIIIMLVVFSGLLLISSALSFKAISQDKNNFIHANVLNYQQGQLSHSWQTLLKTRVIINRVAIRILKKQTDPAAQAAIAKLLTDASASLTVAADHFALYKNSPAVSGQSPELATQVASDFQQLSDTLSMSVQYLRANNYDAYSNLDTQKAQEMMDDIYRQWCAQNDVLLAGGMEQNQHSYSHMTWTLATVLLVLVLLVLAIWVVIRTVLLAPLNQVTTHIKGIAGGDLSGQLQVEGRSEMGLLAAHLTMMQQSLRDTVGHVRDSAGAIYSGANDISQGNNDLSARTEQQAASLEQTAASMEQLTATVKQNAENARQASQLAKSASETAEKGGQVVDGVVKTMSEIAGSSQKIADIISVIDGIAFQTNILALNAAVEAARAGEQGRGFAVVAGEVRNLAQRSAQAAKEIKTLIEASVNRVDAGSQQVTVAGETMHDIVAAVMRVTDIMGEIASASDEQSRGIDQIGHAVTEMDRVTQQNAALVQESAAGAALLEQQASRLSQAVAAFKTDGQAARLNQLQNTPVPSAAAMPPPRRLPSPPKAQAAEESNWETF
ncbi:HAMP domain-containing protein [Erwinia psidii]|uniref:HAMP domain-containing protein n=1 Tax=Erwinia psidii TaxID=69224 RepID=A0A3N6RZC9_9GAMM|nr:HAMP domain-containing protein [Erwinia psidii]MCX8960899.1 HAMP domain-containing protein [Erwinia psidii]MCX8964861.1 HAMP domain-containing protein [Erwinia psidii]RQM38568.1 HAMP domain-containing protein [Erwinia psidii]